MPLILHILIALSSIIMTALAFFTPSKLKLQISSAFVFLTLASGTYLVIAAQASMVRTCLAGLVYIGIMISALIAVRSKLSLIPQSSDKQ